MSVDLTLVWAGLQWTSRPRLAALPMWAWLSTVVILLLGGPGDDVVFGGAGINGGFGQAGSLREICGEIGGDESGGGIQNDHIARRSRFACENEPDDPGIGIRIAAFQRLQAARSESRIVRVNRERVHRSALNLRHQTGPGEGELVQSIFSEHDPDMICPERGECFCHDRDQRALIHADDTATCAGGIRERTKNIKERSNTDFAARRGGMFHGGVQGDGE